MSQQVQVYLKKTVPSLGQSGDVKTVKAGYARNFLIPQKLAEIATPEHLKKARELAEQKEKEQTEAKQVFAEIKSNVKAAKVMIVAKAADNKTLYSAVSASQIANAVSKELKHEIPADWIIISKPVKTLGEHEALIKKGDQEIPIKISIKTKRIQKS